MAPTHGNPQHAGGLHHVELYTAALEESLPFWEWLLGEFGYQEKHDWDGGRSWIREAMYIVLVETERGSPAFDRKAPGLNHLAFHGESRDQVDQLTSTVRERGDAAVLYEADHPYAGGYYALYCEAPGGLKVEVVAPEA